MIRFPSLPELCLCIDYHLVKEEKDIQESVLFSSILVYESIFIFI